MWWIVLGFVIAFGNLFCAFFCVNNTVNERLIAAIMAGACFALSIAKMAVLP